MEISALWDVCKEAFQRRSINLTYPTGTDFTRTYQYKYLQSLQRHLSDWHFDDDLTIAFIDIIAGYAKKHNLLKKGLAIFFQRNVLDICRAEFKRRIEEQRSVLSAVSNVKVWLEQQCQSEHSSLMLILIKRQNKRAYPNIVKWFISGQLPAVFLAISRSCIRALSKLSAEERCLLPKDSSLYSLRLYAIADCGIADELRSIMGNDWRQMPCLN